MPILEDVRDHLKAAVAAADAAKVEAQAKLDAVEAELAKPEVPVADQLKALVAKL